MSIKTELYREAMRGKDAEEFFKSEIGRYVLAQSKAESDEATEALKSIHPTDARGIAELQFKIHCAVKAVDWLENMITNGRQAMEHLEAMEDAEG